MMIASTPTSSRALSSTVIIRMFKAEAMASATISRDSTSTMFSTVESPRMLRSRRKISSATIPMSRTSAQPNCRNPNMPSTFVIRDKVTKRFRTFENFNSTRWVFGF